MPSVTARSRTRRTTSWPPQHAPAEHLRRSPRRQRRDGCVPLDLQHEQPDHELHRHVHVEQRWHNWRTTPAPPRRSLCHPCSNSKTYTCRVVATNDLGDSAPSLPSAAFVAATAPDTPTVTGITRTSNAASVAFTIAANNGAAITGYRATCTSSDGGATKTNTSTKSPISVTTLTNSKTYTCVATAANIIGVERGIGSVELVHHRSRHAIGTNRYRRHPRPEQRGGRLHGRLRRWRRHHELQGDVRIVEPRCDEDRNRRRLADHRSAPSPTPRRTRATWLPSTTSAPERFRRRRARSSLPTSRPRKTSASQTTARTRSRGRLLAAPRTTVRSSPVTASPVRRATAARRRATPAPARRSSSRR